ncbi:glycosyltransferase [Alteromonas sp. KUL49]|uniref:glycosyltransferase n=1 Tax=Alteromonas sp. KUL49 TaxID=2480798 RepID=UPI00102EFE39|nr:glycosyltransferase [Alteromonas sp. KUL49]TAP37877.1 glycosyltransferase family 1 protein [Alteromonas sp. KUL49]GEA12736.1 hypothetical protein KUL49_31110 [Alteromonas sp. KUL49]
MEVFNHYLPWTKKRVQQISPSLWKELLAPCVNIIQDQNVPITNLMVLLYGKINRKADFSTFRKRCELISWFDDYGRSIYNIDLLEDVLAGRHCDEPKLVPGGVNLVGYSRGRLGLGEDLRGYASLLDSLKVNYTVYHIGHPTDDPISYNHPKEDKIKYDRSIFFLNAIELSKFVSTYGDITKSFGRSVAIPPWELSEAPIEWKSTLSQFEEVWGISRFTTSALKNVCPNVKYSAPVVLPLSDRSRLTKSRDSLFRFAFIFDAGSYEARKNPLAVIRSFQSAFHSNQAVELVVKASNIRSSVYWDEVCRVGKSDRRIKIISKLYTREELEFFWQSIDCYVSLHCSEGFGRTIAEAIQREIPVISTAFSGSMDMFPDDYPWLVDYEMKDIGEGMYPFCGGLQWAYASECSAAKKMRDVFTQRGNKAINLITENSRRYLESNFELDGGDRQISRWLKCEKV